MSDENQTQEKPTNERPTHTIETTHGHKVEIKDWITGREEDEIQKVHLDQIEIKQRQGVGGGKKGSENAAQNQQQMEQEITGMRGSVQLEMEYKTIEMLVVSVDGLQDKIVDRVLDLRNIDRNEVRAEIDRITDGETEDEKKT